MLVGHKVVEGAFLPPAWQGRTYEAGEGGLGSRNSDNAGQSVP